MKTITETRMSKWADKRDQIEKEAREIAEALRNENARVFDEMMGDPIAVLERIYSIC